jgi:hypothetical protein
MQTDFAFPQSLAEKYRPTRIADFIGLERPKRVLARLQASRVGRVAICRAVWRRQEHDGAGALRRATRRVA